jgi:hypothetical protein
MSERQIRKDFKAGDLVDVTKWIGEETERKRGVLECLLSAQYFVQYVSEDPTESPTGDFFFYGDNAHMTLIERDGKPASHFQKKKKTRRKKKVVEGDANPLIQ